MLRIRMVLFGAYEGCGRKLFVLRLVPLWARKAAARSVRVRCRCTAQSRRPVAEKDARTRHARKRRASCAGGGGAPTCPDRAQGLAEMEDVHGIIDEHGEGAGEAPSTSGPSNLDESAPEQTPGGVGGATQGVAYSVYSSARLQVRSRHPSPPLSFPLDCLVCRARCTRRRPLAAAGLGSFCAARDVGAEGRGRGREGRERASGCPLRRPRRRPTAADGVAEAAAAAVSSGLFGSACPEPLRLVRPTPGVRRAVRPEISPE